MGPPLVNGGNTAAAAKRCACISSFNGAAVSERRKCPFHTPPKYQGQIGFNGAAVSERRKCAAGVQQELWSQSLQWGRR